jgi:hypothetical protein
VTPREELEKMVRNRARRLGDTLPAISKMKKADLQILADNLKRRMLIAEIKDDAEYLDKKKRQELHRDEHAYESVMSALLQTHSFSLEDLEQWDWDKLTLTEKPASEYISIRSRASVRTKYVDASITINSKFYNVTSVCVWSEANGI